MIAIFDLDDTLYPEFDYVKSGFKAVSYYLDEKHGIPSDDSFTSMLNILAQNGRGAVFDLLLKHYHLYSKARVKECVKVYRYHAPNLVLPNSTREVLNKLTGNKYIVTDGHKTVQANKVAALNINQYVNKVYITHRYGLINAKPSTYCFELIRKREQCEWSDMCYVGDNPTKDFVNLNRLGVHTIRVTTGEYAKLSAKPGFDAKYSIKSLGELIFLLKGINNEL